MTYKLHVGGCKDLSRLVLLEGPLVLAEQVQVQARRGLYLIGSVHEAIITDQAVIIKGEHYTAAIPDELFAAVNIMSIPTYIGQCLAELTQSFAKGQVPVMLLNGQIKPL